MRKRGKNLAFVPARNLEPGPAEYESRGYYIFNRLWPETVHIIRTQFLPHRDIVLLKFKDKLFNSVQGNDCCLL
jgi:hypothetical protein